jgi:hypothetical protein
MYQNEAGTWHREDLADHLPPLEDRVWLCSGCWRVLCDQEREALSARIFAGERIVAVSELHLKRAVYCHKCHVLLEGSAVVEVY